MGQASWQKVSDQSYFERISISVGKCHMFLLFSDKFMQEAKLLCL